MNEKEKIEQLKSEILAKREELKLLTKEHYLDFSEYCNFEKGTLHIFCPELRAVVRGIIAAQQDRRIDGSYYITRRKDKKIKEWDAEDFKLANELIHDLYPIIEKYVNLAIKRNGARGVENE